MYMFNPIEVDAALSEAKIIPDLLGSHMQQESNHTRIFLSALCHYVEKTSPYSKDEVLENLNISNIESPSDLSEQMRLLFVHMVKVGVEDEPSSKTYTTGDVSRFFGVTVATVNNWINDNRITGVEKGVRFKQARIPETSIYKSVAGDVMTIREAAQLYEIEKSQISMGPLTPCEELQEILKEIIFFERKYGGEYKTTLAIKEVLTPIEIRDASEWKQLLHEIKDYHV